MCKIIKKLNFLIQEMRETQKEGEKLAVLGRWAIKKKQETVLLERLNNFYTKIHTTTRL